LRDVTARRATERAEKEAKEAALAANEAKSHFIAVMSHELRTPLNGIIGFSKILREESFGPLGSDNYKTFAGDIHDCGQQLLSIVNDILQVARLDAGEVKIQMEDFEIGRVIEACAAEFSAEIERASKTMRIAVPAQLRLHADERLLRGALFQLLSNSVKFTRVGDLIDIKLSARDSGGVRIEISDTGIGVDAAQLPRLTEAFYQADASLSRSHGGTGLGLYIVKRYVELHGGVLTLETEKNSFFRACIDLPAACLSQFRDAA
jgi:two-component system cell cycle sensor histidine kinase PleC